MKSRLALLVLVFFATACSKHAVQTEPVDVLPSAEPFAGYPSGLPIPSDHNAPWDEKFCATYKAWGNRLITERYQQLHPGEAATPGFLHESFAYLVNLTEQARNRLSAQADELARAGIKDPAFELMAGLLQLDVPKKEALLGEAMTGFQKGGYSQFLLFMAAANLSKSLAERGANESEIATVDRIALAALKAGLDRQSFKEDDMSALRWRLCGGSVDTLFQRHGLEAAEIFKSANTLPAWVKEFGQGKSFLSAAWGARGDEWADSVTAGGWAGFAENLQHARAHFTTAWELNPREPGAAACMIAVTMGESGDKKLLRLWFDRAVAAQMDFKDAYQSFIWALRPRWHGSHQEMLLFADECVRSGRFDTLVPAYYLKVVREVASEEDDHDAIYKRPEIYRNLKFVLDSYLRTSTMPFSTTYAHTLAAIFDYKNGNLPGARNHLAALKFRPDRTSDLWLLEDVPRMVEVVSSL